MHIKHHAHLTLFSLTDGDCGSIPDELDIGKIVEGMLTIPPDLTTPYPNYTIPPDYLTTPFPIPDWPARFVQADYTHTLMTFYAGFNVAWAVTCFIAIGKWKKRAVEDSC